jgi:hypothetical protein
MFGKAAAFRLCRPVPSIAACAPAGEAEAGSTGAQRPTESQLEIIVPMSAGAGEGRNGIESLQILPEVGADPVFVDQFMFRASRSHIKPALLQGFRAAPGTSRRALEKCTGTKIFSDFFLPRCSLHK